MGINLLTFSFITARRTCSQDHCHKQESTNNHHTIATIIREVVVSFIAITAHNCIFYRESLSLDEATAIEILTWVWPFHFLFPCHHHPHQLLPLPTKESIAYHHAERAIISHVCGLREWSVHNLNNFSPAGVLCRPHHHQQNNPGHMYRFDMQCVQLETLERDSMGI